MELKKIKYDFTICKLQTTDSINLDNEFQFLSKTDEEISLVCKTTDVPKNVIKREDGWRGFRIEGILDFSLIGILSKISNILKENNIGIFVVSTYNTDYIFVKKENFDRALEALIKEEYKIL